MKQVIILFIISNLFLFAQEKIIDGKIVDAESLLPLSSANILIEGTETGTTTNSNGIFQLSASFNNEQTLRISYVGYQTRQIKISDYLTSQEKIIMLEQMIIPSQTILVTGSIGMPGLSPIAFAKIKRKDIEKDYTVQDVPEYLSTLPSTTFYSESGNNLGYNYISIRGFDQRRISVSVNGIPQNDPEDHNVYWLDFPDLLASTELIQVQRGSGSGVIGYPAIGGSINIITSNFSDKKSLNLSSSIGSYNTRKYSASYSSGLVDNKYSFYAKLSKLLSSGYKNSSWIDFNSYHFSAIRYDKDFATQLNFFGGPVADGLSYTGLPKFTVKDKNLRRLNLSYWETEGDKFSYTLKRRPDEIENFSQPHFELLNEYNISDNVSFNSALFLILGNGFFDYDGSWADTSYFRLTSDNGFKPNGNPGNALIRAMVENRQYGWIPRLSIKHKNGELLIGSEIRIHRSLHWGSINYAENLPAGITKEFRYYQYKGAVDIFNFFVHETFNVNNNINFFGEAQLAYNKYRLYEEKYLNNDFSLDNLFLNPRLGINYKPVNELNLFAAFARVSRVPRLKNYYDAAESSGGELPQFGKNTDGSYNFNDPLVKPEKMNDFEIGSSYLTEKYSFGLNLFYMMFNDEIVKSGQIDRFGQPVTGNAEKTIHTGIEISGNFKLFDFIELVLNGTYSKNYISKGVTFIKTKINDVKTILPLDISKNKIGGFPDYLLNGIIKFNYKGIYANVEAKYVGKFYSDNYDENLKSYLTLYPDFVDYSDNVVDPYFEANLFISYEFQPKYFLTSLKIFGQVNNLFNNLYASYAIGKEFFPSAERNFLTGIQLGL
ncbi:MAG: TonB-dependent receptor [Ignavibacteriales bacterium]|nr:TonB-dependent receptor [Ignavibacteriales bacterium]